MTRIFAVSLIFASPALAHGGLDHPPHGAGFGWMVAASLGLALPWACARLTARLRARA